MPNFNKVLRSLREEQDITRKELARRTGVSQSSINMYERGEREPGFETLEIFADYFNVDMDYLLGKSDNRRPELILGAENKNSPTISEGEQMLLDLFRQIPEDKQTIVLQMIRAALNH